MVKGNQNEEVEGGYLCVKVTHFDCSERASEKPRLKAGDGRFPLGNRSTSVTHARMNVVLWNQSSCAQLTFPG